MTDYLDKRYNANKTLRISIDDIKQLAMAFNITGNSQVAENLFFIAKDIANANDLYEESFTELFNNAFDATQQATSNMVQAALNVAVNIKR